MITEQDLTLRLLITDEVFAKITAKTPYVQEISDILQTIYVGSSSSEGIEEVRKKILRKFHRWICLEKEGLEALNVLERSIEVYTYVEGLKEEFPDLFPEGLGYYSKRRLAELFVEGKVRIEGLDVEGILRKEKEEREERERRKEQAQAERRRIAEEKEREYAERENSRIPLQPGMLFKNNTHLYTCFDNLDLFKKKCKTSLQKESDKYFTKIFDYHEGYSQRCWKIVEVFSDEPRAYLDKIINVEEFTHAKHS